MKANGVVVFVPKYGIEGPIYLTPKAGEVVQDVPMLTLDEEAQRVTSVDGAIDFRVFDVVHVKISVKEPTPNRPKLHLALLSALS